MDSNQMTTKYSNGIQCLLATIVIVYDIMIYVYILDMDVARILVILPGISVIYLAT